jgi:hypothetical protein
MFQHRRVIFRELINSKWLLSSTGTSSASHPHFHHHVVYCSLYTLTWDTLYAWAQRDPIGSYTVTDVCIHNPENIYNCKNVTQEAHYSMLLFQQYGVVLVNMCNLEFKHFKFFSFLWWRWGWLAPEVCVGLWSFVVNKLPEIDTFVSKHVGVGT